MRTGSMHPSLSAPQLTQASFSAFVMRIRYAISIPLSPTIEATCASGAITCETNYQAFIPKKLEVLELTVPPRMFLLSNPVRFI